MKTIEEITKILLEANDVIKDKHKDAYSCSIISTDLTDVIADLQAMIDNKEIEIASMPEFFDKPQNVKDAKLRQETIELRRLKSMAQGRKSTLNKMEYNFLK